MYRPTPSASTPNSLISAESRQPKQQEFERSAADGGDPAISERKNDPERDGSADYQFIEIMSCPGGCVNGGGQPIQSAYVRNNTDIRALRAEAIYKADAAMELRRSHENPAVKALYDEYLGQPNSHLAHKILHTRYIPRNNY